MSKNLSSNKKFKDYQIDEKNIKLNHKIFFTSSLIVGILTDPLGILSPFFPPSKISVPKFLSN